ncbi:MAG: heparinase II/III family protein [Lentisphaerae bacterium]|nr:heparinase II/III family protein [Lentisphaerota bacterium]
MNFNFGAAKKLYARKLHPRLFIGPDDVEPLRRKARSPYGRKVMAALRGKLSPTIGQIVGSNDPATLLKPDKSNSFAPVAIGHVCEIGLVGLLDNDGDAIEAARRLLLNTGGCLGYGIGSEAFDLIASRLRSEDRRAFAARAAGAIRKQVPEARSHYLKHAGHNITIAQNMDWALFALLAIEGEPGAGELESEKADLLRFFEATLNVVIGPDGYPEEDMGYGTMVAGGIMGRLAEALRRAGLYDAYRQCPRYARFGQAILHFVQPWGRHLIVTGDHSDEFRWRETILARQASETREPALLWLLGTLLNDPAEEVLLRKGFQTPATLMSLMFADDFKKARHPSLTRPPTQFRDRGRGIVSFRSGWRPDDTFVVFDGSQRSPSAQGHAHASCGHFSLSALGEYFGIDAGRYNIEQNCHNVVLIDGQSGRSTNGDWSYAKHDGLLTDYLPDAFCDFAAVDSSHQHNCYWARRYLGLVKGDGAPSYVWTMEDINKANDWAEFWWQLHTSPVNTITLHDTRAEITGGCHGNRLDVHFALPAPDSYPKPHAVTLSQDEATPSSTHYITDPYQRAKRCALPLETIHYSRYVRPRLLAKVSGYNGRFMSVMIPRRITDEPAKIERLPSIDNSLAVKITFATVEDTLIFAYEHNLLEAGGVNARGQWCVVRQSRATGKVLTYALGHGARLTVDGKRLI